LSFETNNRRSTSLTLPLRWYLLEKSTSLTRFVFYGNGSFMLNTSLKFLENERFSLWSKSYYVADREYYQLPENGRHYRHRFYLKSQLEGRDSDFFLWAIGNYAFDPYFLRDYLDGYEQYFLKSYGLLRKFVTPHRWDFQILAFQPLLECNIAIKETPPLTFLINYEWQKLQVMGIKNLIYSIRFMGLEALQHQRKFFTQLDFRQDYRWNVVYTTWALNFRGDIYYGSASESNRKKRYYHRLYPELQLQLRLPLGMGKHLFFNPMVQYFYTYGKAKIFTDLDSRASELTLDNIFTSNRYRGYDLVEIGHRLNYGLKVSLHTKFGNIDSTLAQGYRNFIMPVWPLKFFTDKFSVILVNVTYKLGKTFIGYDIHLDRESYRIIRDNIFFSSSWNDKLFYKISRINYWDNSLQHLAVDLNWKITTRVSTSFSWNEDLNNRHVFQAKFGLFYSDGCYSGLLEIGGQQLPNSAKIYPSFNFGLNILE
jgi:hypothetical protein